MENVDRNFSNLTFCILLPTQIPLTAAADLVCTDRRAVTRRKLSRKTVVSLAGFTGQLLYE